MSGEETQPERVEWSDPFPTDGIVNRRAVNPTTVPGKVPSGAAVWDSGTTIALSWAFPATGSAVTDYDIQARFADNSGTNYSNWYSLNHVGTDRTKNQVGIVGRRYQFRVRGGNSAGEGPYSDAFPSDGVVAVVVTVPGKVIGGRVVTSNNKIVISWDAPTSGSPVTGYGVNYRSDTSGGTSYGNWINFSFSGTSRSLSITRDGINGSRYQFRIRGDNSAGDGEWSDTFPEDGGIPGQTRTSPGKVAGSSAAAVPKDGSVSIAWSAPTTGNAVTDYDIRYRFDSNGGTSYGNWTNYNYNTLSTSRVATIPGTNGYRYQFSVRGGNSVGEGPYSDAFPSDGVIPRTAPASPGKVTDVRVSARDSFLSVSWDAPSGTVTDYDLFYRVDNTGGTSYGVWLDLSHSGTTTSYSIRNTSINGRRYQFRVRANNGATLGAWSDATPSGGAVPDVVRTIPGKVSGGAVAASDGSMTITWDEPTTGSPVDRYVIEYRVDTGGGTSYGGWTGITTTNTSRTFTRTVFNARRYQYRVHGVNSAGNGAWSDAFPSGGVVAVATAPLVPTNGNAVAGDGTVSISWTFTAQVSSFTVQWREVTIGMAGIVGLTSFSSTGITENLSARTAVHPGAVNETRYQYRVRATFQGTSGAYTQPFPSGGVVPVAPVVVVVTVPGKPGTPSGVTGNNTVTVSWDAPMGSVTVSSYRLEYKTSTGGLNQAWKLISSTIGGGTTSYRHTGLTNGTGYSYRVRGTNDGGNGAWSTVSDLLTPAGVPGKPGDLTLTRSTSRQGGSWGFNSRLVVSNQPANGGSAIISYYFGAEYRSSTNWITSSLSQTVQATSGDVLWEFRSAFSRYRTRIRATNANGHGPWSDWADSAS